MSNLAFVEQRFSDLLGTLGPMPPSVLRPPDATEFAPFYAGYVARVARVTDPIDELSAQHLRVLSLLSRVSEERSRYRYAAGKWSVREIVVERQ